ncbi:molybdate ABC transporter substrate-binding protein [Pelagovum pacificum]|uniref:Molybdate ABC transporter substrate-binding protein n=1 Tax=Pelagovum pacificum TaxID=2588711 RepID=A0A5C5GA28_9RHOB|nr:molybdate ABC transporter substrate-binding protein [Pelagovum pacificum]QQA41579.1 molybdate ABC transporter substrate-binding protein [Pelagovum pacificum]TNY30858.1 molybdate ABC transporter substrate-binding protein [Pelagovum pacificum]
MFRWLFPILMFATPLPAEPLTIFAAASLAGPLDEVAAERDDVAIAYAGSGAIARQIDQGAPADVVLLANTDWMDWLDGRGLVTEPRLLFSNRIVLVAPAGAGTVELTDEGLDVALGDGRLAIGLVESVPAGIYGKAALEGLGLWDEVSTRLAEAENVRAALALVARGEAPLGLVYATDAAAEPGVSVVADLPEDSHPQILYVGALIAGNDAPGAAEFLDAVASHPAFPDAGFLPVDE